MAGRIVSAMDKLRPEVKQIFYDYCKKNQVALKKVEIIGRKDNNFLSELWKVRIVGTKQVTEKEYSAGFVVKELPMDNKYVEIYNCDIAFRNESFAYQSIIPNLQKYSPRPLPFPKCIYSSSNIIIMEDLAERGFQHFNKLTGFKIPLVKSILSELANVHAASLIMKCKDQKQFDNLTNTVEEIVYRNDKDTTVLVTQERCLEVAIKMLENNKENFSQIISNIKKISGKTKDLQLELLNRRTGPFPVINHGDLWANNILLKDKSVELIDFQTMRYTSLAADLSYFLYVNLDPDFRVQHEDEFLRHYYTELINNIKAHNLPVEAELTYENLMEEMKMYSVFGFVCGLWVLPVFYKAINNLEKNEQSFHKYNSANVQTVIDNMCPAQASRLLRLVLSYASHLKDIK